MQSQTVLHETNEEEDDDVVFIELRKAGSGETQFIHSSQNASQTEINPAPISTNANQSDYGDQVQIKKEDGLLRFTLKGDSRCRNCIVIQKEECTILLGKQSCSIVLCDYCREFKNPLVQCRPNFDLLHHFSPDHPQIVHSKDQLNSALAKRAVRKALRFTKRANQAQLRNENVGLGTETTNELNEIDSAASSMILIPSTSTENSAKTSSNSTATTRINNPFSNKTTNSSLCNRLTDVEKILEAPTETEAKISHALILLEGIKRDFFLFKD